MTFPPPKNAHVLHLRLTPQACNSTEASRPSGAMFVQAFFIPQSTMPPFPPSCKRALAPSAAIRKKGAIEEEEGEGEKLR